MPATVQAAVAYIRTANSGPDADSEKRQIDAVLAYATRRYEIVATFFGDLGEWAPC